VVIEIKLGQTVLAEESYEHSISLDIHMISIGKQLVV